MRTLTRTELRSSHLRAFALDSERVALVPEQAVLLAGDHVTVVVRVGAHQRLEIVEPGGTVAYAMRGSAARWDLRVEVETGGSLLWHGEPFVVSEGADVLRSTSIDLASGARATLRETMVLGRSGQAAGRLVMRTDIHRDGVPVLVEELDSALGLGQSRVVDQVLRLGGCEAQAPERCTEMRAQRASKVLSTSTTVPMVLESGDLLHRWLGTETHASPLTCFQSSPSAE